MSPSHASMLGTDPRQGPSSLTWDRVDFAVGQKREGEQTGVVMERPA